MPRRIFVGDVQGCREELEELLELLAFDPAADELHPVGDLVNRGPDSLGTLRLLRRLGAGGVLGNHDLHLLHTAAGTRSLSPRDTLDDVLAAPDRDELLAWLAARPFARAFDDTVTVHAGFHPSWSAPLDELDGLDPYSPGASGLYAVRVRRVAADGSIADARDTSALPWYRAFNRARVDGRTVVFGHWAEQGLFRDTGLVGLDSGCVWGGALSAWIEGEDRIVQVPARREYATID